ncbi:MAG: hypothetical protein RLZZ28_1396 [Bacteroidota bacterium]
MGNCSRFVSMAIVLFDNSNRTNLYPLTYTKALADLRFGILTIQERWERLTGLQVWVHTADYLRPLYAPIGEGLHYWIDASFIPCPELVTAILSLREGESISQQGQIIAAFLSMDASSFNQLNSFAYTKAIEVSNIKSIHYPWELVQLNDAMIRYDFGLISAGRQSAPIPGTVNIAGAENVFLEEGASLSFCTLNALTGPVYIGKNAVIMEGASIRGPFCLGENSVVKMNSRIYGATSLGPGCLGGGEIKNTILMANSNKAHDGYLGDAVIGEWCNFGAGSTNSNIKNTASDVKVWNMGTESYMQAGNKCGVMMGDYTRVSINASINTGAVMGISCNVFGAGLLPTIVPNFSWGVDGTRYEFNKAIDAIRNWKALKGKEISSAEIAVLAHIFSQS